MRLYVIRHAESEGNAKGLHQFKHTKLSNLGLRQAKKAAQQLIPQKIELIIASPLPRAKETAIILGKELKCPIKYSNLLTAIRRPSEILGKRIDDPEVLKIKKTIDKYWGKKGYRYSDEETFDELMKRGKETLKLIENIKRQNVLLVAHGAITRMIVGLVLLGKYMRPKYYLLLSDKLRTNNTGITTFECLEKTNWTLLSWNQ